MKLTDYKHDILALATARGVTVDVGLEMFLHNVELGKNFTQGVSTDYAALKPHYAELSTQKDEFMEEFRKQWKK